MRIVIIDTSVPINTRNAKIEDSLKEFYKDVEVFILTWKRDEKKISIPANYIVFEAGAAYGNKIEKLKRIFDYANFVRVKLSMLLPDIIISSHWDSMLITPTNLPNKPILIYENLDIPTGPWLIRKFIQILESKKLNKFDLIVHASRFYQELYPKSKPQFVLENKSKFNFRLDEQSTHKPFVVSYIGTVRYRNILENFIKAASKIGDVEVKIFGGGYDLEYLKSVSKGYTNIFFYGTYSFSQIPQLYEQSDLVWAAYPNKDYNVKYAISNKFYESMMCGKPCIYANNTRLGEYVSINKLGYTVDPYSEKEIKKLIEDIKKNISEYEIVKQNIIRKTHVLTTWDEDFAKIVEFINRRLKERYHE